MKIKDLIKFAEEKGIKLDGQEKIINEAKNIIKDRYGYSLEKIKANFDDLLGETEREAYKLYLNYQHKYGEKVFDVFIKECVIFQ